MAKTIIKVKHPEGHTIRISANKELEEVLDLYGYFLRKLSLNLTDEELGAAIRRVYNGDIK